MAVENFALPDIIPEDGTSSIENWKRLNFYLIDSQAGSKDWRISTER